MVQRVKDPALSLQWLGSLLWREFDPWPGKFYILRMKPKKKKKKKKIKTQRKAKRNKFYFKKQEGSVILTLILDKDMIRKET